MADPKQPIDPQKEIEIQVGELEERVDRLRAIYEQYFMGYEKLEPTVPRKDVDRRFVQLRKANIRNTALRFRFNVVTQKFNTYAMYWTRICRQIEEGTFKRHIQKANKRFGIRARNNADDFSIDVELGDFEVDMDDFENEEADAAASTPPPAAAAGAARAVAAGFDADPDAADTVPPSAGPAAALQPQHGGHDAPHAPRVARHAVLPSGAKARVLVKKGPGAAPGPAQPGQPRARMPSVTDEAPPASTGARPPPSVRRPPQNTDVPPTPRPPMGSVPDAPSTSVIRAASPQGHVHRSPPGVQQRPHISPNAQSVRRIPAARPSEPGSPQPQPQPQAQQQSGGTARPPATQPTGAAPPPSVRTPAVPPAAPPPAFRAPQSSRMPIGLPSSVNRVPAAGPGAPVAPPPAARPPAGGPPPSERRLPVPPPSQRMPASPPVRQPSPSVPDSESAPHSRRPPPPLPSQIKKG